MRTTKVAARNLENILRLKTKSPELTAPQIAERLGLSARQVRYVLQGLRKALAQEVAS